MMWFASLFAVLVFLGLRRPAHGFSTHLMVLVVALVGLMGSFFFSLGR